MWYLTWILPQVVWLVSPRVRTDDAAVSSVIGTVLMLTVTVVVFSGLGVVVLKEFESNPGAPRTDLVAISRGTLASSTMLIAHQGGESIPLGDGFIVVNVGQYAKETKLSALKPEILAHLGPTWDPGESLCVRGPGPLCMNPQDDEVRGAYVVVSNTLMVDVGERGKPGIAPPRPDVTISLVSQAPAKPWVDQDVTWTFKITNKGVVATPGAVALTVQVGSDIVAAVSTPGSLAPGASVDMQTPIWKAKLGFHSLSATVDPNNLIDESNEVNNQYSSSVYIEPKQPFLDKNEDGVYQQGIDELITITPGGGDKWVYNAGVHGLVIPAGAAASTGGNWVGKQFDFTAGDNGNDFLIIGVNLINDNGEGHISITGPAKIQLDGITLINSKKTIMISSSQGTVQAIGTKITAKEEVRVEAHAGLTANGANIVSTEENILLKSQAAGLVLNSAPSQTVIQAKKGVDFTAATTLQANGANIKSTDYHVSLTGASISANSGVTTTSIQAKKNVELTATASLQANGASITSTDEKVIVKANGGISLNSGSAVTAIRAKEQVEVTAGTSIQAVKATIRSIDGSNNPNNWVILKANNGPIDFNNGTLVAKDYSSNTNSVDSFVMEAINGAINVKDATISVKSNLRFKVDNPCTTFTVLVDKVKFTGADTSAQIVPAASCATGTPTTGTIV